MSNINEDQATLEREKSAYGVYKPGPEPETSLTSSARAIVNKPAYCLVREYAI